jgi:uncharacterized protein YkwD
MLVALSRDVAVNTSAMASLKISSTGGLSYFSEGVLSLIEFERGCRGLQPVHRNHELKVAARSHARAAVQIKWWVEKRGLAHQSATHSTAASRIKAALSAVRALQTSGSLHAKTDAVTSHGVPAY